MPARIITNSHGSGGSGAGKDTKQLQAENKANATLKAPQGVSNKRDAFNASMPTKVSATSEHVFTDSHDRTKFYTGHERLNLQSTQVQRIQDLQTENDKLQREISEKEKEIVNCRDPLAILADIEHRKIMIARNTGEILKIYSTNEDRLKRISELEMHNRKIQQELAKMQDKFIEAATMDERTRCASEFFVLKSLIDRNQIEIDELNRD